jgi:hypothetical protein
MSCQVLIIVNKTSQNSFVFGLLLTVVLVASVFISTIIFVRAQPVDPSTFRDLLMLSGDNTVEAIDGDNNVVWSVPFFGTDKEMLPNGNLLLTNGNMSGTASIMEVNIATDQKIWEIFYLDGMDLEFTHDTDWLGVDEFGQDIFLTADTSNDRVIEFFRNGTVIWTWYAEDHYDYPKTAGTDWTHLNDVDRLADGTTMISIKNFNKVIIVNTTATGEILWEYGDYYDDTMLNGPHNPEITPTGTLLVPDADNNRIIEVNMTTKQIIWEYGPPQTSDEFLGWPRDADILPNGNMLICDSRWRGSGRNTIWEINVTTKDVAWHYDTTNINYDADRLDTVLPTVNIAIPVADSYDGTEGVTISLNCDDPWYDEMFYRIYDETTEQWLTDHNVTYEGETEVTLENQHTYTLYAWAKDVMMEGGAYPTSRAIVQLEESSVQFNTNVDQTAPEISELNVTEQADITFTAKVTDDWSGINQVTLDYVYTNENGTKNSSVNMINTESDIWSATIPLFSVSTNMTYTITTEDNAGNTATTEMLEYNYVTQGGTSPEPQSEGDTSQELPPPEIPMIIIIAAILAIIVVAGIILYFVVKKGKSSQEK